VRIYGVPLQAWNLEFFKLCVYDFGRLLKVDDSTLEKIRFDYARVLVSTSSLDLINTDAKVMVDGVIFDFKIVEEGGFSLGEDACFSDDDVPQDEGEMGHEGNHAELTANGEIKKLLNHLSEEWKKEQHDSQAHQGSASNYKPMGETTPVAASVAKLSPTVSVGRNTPQDKGTTQPHSGTVV